MKRMLVGRFSTEAEVRGKAQLVCCATYTGKHLQLQLRENSCSPPVLATVEVEKVISYRPQFKWTGYIIAEGERKTFEATWDFSPKGLQILEVVPAVESRAALG